MKPYGFDCIYRTKLSANTFVLIVRPMRGSSLAMAITKTLVWKRENTVKGFGPHDGRGMPHWPQKPHLLLPKGHGTKEVYSMQGTLERQRLQNQLSADLSCIHRESHRDKKVAGEK